MNVKNQQLLWDLHAGIARDAKNQWLYGNYMRVLQGMFKKPSGYYGTYMRVLQRMKTINDFLWPIYGYWKECKMPTAIMGLLWGYCNECKMHVAIFGLICGYCIFENGLMEFIIENDVGIICLKCVDCFKSLQVMWVLLY